MMRRVNGHKWLKCVLLGIFPNVLEESHELLVRFGLPKAVVTDNGPQFLKLEAPARRPVHSRNPKIIFTKNSYSEGVKYRHWQEVLEHKPIDIDPFCHDGRVNQFLSHYRRLGTDDDGKFLSTTHEMLKQVFIRNKMTRDKLISNYYSYNDNAECLTEYKECCPQVCSDEFLTTMQHSYQMPHPYVMQRLAFPKIPFLRHRKFKQEEPDIAETKFQGENYFKQTRELQKHKGDKWISYNPLTGDYDDYRKIQSE